MYDTNATEQLGHIHADFLVKDIGDNLDKFVNKFINKGINGEPSRFLQLLRLQII